MPMPVNFDLARFSLLDRAIVCAHAHVRGGGDSGKEWHKAGRMMNKMNTFTDFIAVVEHLTGSWSATHKDGPVPCPLLDRNKVVIEGSSAGGLLMAVVVNMRPELFRVAILKAPFVDIMNTQFDKTLPLTTTDFEEWGDPTDPDVFRYMIRYAPYENLRLATYPAMLVRAGWNDSQVMYWEAAKYVARQRTLRRDKRLLILTTNMTVGHRGPSGRYDALQETAFDQAFILDQLGITND